MTILHNCVRSISKKLFPYQFIRHFCEVTPSDFEIQHRLPICIKAVPIPLALYGGRHTVTLLPGTGAAPEIFTHVQKILNVIGAPVDFEVIKMDVDRNDNDEFNYALISIKRNGVALKGNIETKTTDISVPARNVALRKELDLYVYVFHCKSFCTVPSRHKDLDIVVVRQNTEGEYAMLEHSIGGAMVVESLKVITVENSTRLAIYAFEYAKKHKRKKVTTVHKANIMKLSDGLFLKVSKEVAKQYPDIEHNDMIIDNCCMQLVTQPQKFDIILTTNLYGSILANVMCGMCGGPGLFSGRNYGEHYAVFEAGVRTSGTSIVGKNIANPVGLLHAAVDMLYHLGHTKWAKQIDKAIFKTICEDKIHTPDIGGQATTTEMIRKIIEHL